MSVSLQTVGFEYEIYDYTAYTKTFIPRAGEILYFNNVETWILNTLSVIGDGTSKINELPFREIVYCGITTNISLESYRIQGNIFIIRNNAGVSKTINIGTTGVPSYITLNATEMITLGYTTIWRYLSIITCPSYWAVPTLLNVTHTTLAAVIERLSSTTSAIGSSLRLLLTSSGDMTDGHGSGMIFAIRDDAGVVNDIGRIAISRAGADNTGKFSIDLYVAGVLGTKMVIDENGNMGIGTTAPKSKLHVVGLPIYANNAAAVAGGLTAGAFYRTGADPDPVCVVH